MKTCSEMRIAALCLGSLAFRGISTFKMVYIELQIHHSTNSIDYIYFTLHKLYTKLFILTMLWKTRLSISLPCLLENRYVLRCTRVRTKSFTVLYLKASPPSSIAVEKENVGGEVESNDFALTS